jgi:predicted DNA-binding transcriptional regulator YafY
MSSNKHAIIRYQTLDRCFRSPKRHYINDLLAACNEAIRDVNPKSEGIKKRQLYEDIKFMQEDKIWSVELFKGNEGKLVYYKYVDPNFSINNKGLNDSEAAQMKEALMILSRFQGMPQFEWVEEVVAKFESSFGLKKGAEKIIGFDENLDYTATKHISTLFNAILYQNPIKVKYKSFKKQTEDDFIIHPYYLKQYNNRWFFFGLNNERKEITNLALDRIIKIEDKIIGKNKIKFIKNTDINFNEFFDDIVGVSVPKDEKVQKIVINIKNEHWPYIETKPLHNSQTRINKEEKDFVTIFIKVIPNYELETLLLSHGEKIAVLEPKIFKDKIMARVKEIK